MIVYGTKGTEIGSQNLKEKCPSCGTENSVRMAMIQKYAHVFWIPFFPIGKTAGTECAHCKQVLLKKEFSPEMQEPYERMKVNAKTPVWTFAGLAVTLVLIGFIIISGRQDDTRNAAYIADPHKGDVYEVKIQQSEYTLYKVKDVVDDSVYIAFHSYQTNKITGLNDLKKQGDAAFTEDGFALTKAQLVALLEKGTIIDIDRK